MRSKSYLLTSVVFVAISGAASAQELTFLAEHSAEVVAPVIEAFEATHPGVTIKLQTVPFVDLSATIEARVGGGDTSVDIIAADTPRVPNMASKGLLEALDEATTAEVRAAVPNAAEIESVSYDGQIYSYPLWSSTNMLFYNRAALEKAGVEMPSADPEKRMTWEELVAVAKQVQDAGGAKYGLMFQQVDRYYQLQPLFESAGGGSGLAGDKMLVPAITSEAWVSTAEWYGELFESGVAPRGIAADQTDTTFGAGDFAFYVGGPWAIPRWIESGLTDFGVAPMPYFEGGVPATPTGAWSWAVSPNSQHKDLAHEFLQFATLTAEGSALTVENFPLPPANPGGFEIFAKRFVENAPEGLADVYQTVTDVAAYELANTAFVRPRSVGFVAFETVMNNAFSDIRNGSDAAETLAAAEEQLKASFSRMN